MQAGKLRHRVTLQSPAGSRDAVGERTTTWTSVHTCWASVEPVTSREAFIAAQAREELTHRVTVRASSEIASLDTSWRVLFGSRVLVIIGVRNIDERGHTLEITCSEGLRDE